MKGLVIREDEDIYDDVEKIEVNQGIFGVFLGKATADQVGNSVHAVAMHDGGANPDGTGAFANGRLFVIPTRTDVVDEFFSVVGDINERRFEFHQGIQRVEDGLHASPFEWGQYLVRNERLALCFFEIFRHFHGSSGITCWEITIKKSPKSTKIRI